MSRMACLATVMAACLAWAEAGLAAPMHEAAKNGDVAKVRQLIEAGADFRAKDEYQQTPMDIAASNGRVDVIRLLLDKGVDVHAPDTLVASAGGSTLGMPLLVAAQAGQVESVKLLVRRDARTRQADRQELDALLRVAVQFGREKLAKWLIEQGANVNAGPAKAKPVQQASGDKEPSLLMLAASEGRYNEKLIALLLAHGARTLEGEDEDRVRIGWAAAEGKTGQLKELLESGGDANYCLVEVSTASCLEPLELAVRNGRLKAAELLLSHGAAMESELGIAICKHDLPMLKLLAAHMARAGGAESGSGRGYSAELAEAVACGDKPTLAYLMERSPQVDYDHVTAILQTLLNPYDPYGQQDGAPPAPPDTALFAALYARDPDFARHASSLTEFALRGGQDAFAAFLFARGGTLSDPDSVLLGAASNGHAASVELLLRHGADVDARTGLGNTPLLLAAPYGDTALAEAVLKHGADVNAKNGLYNTALHMAAARDLTKMAELLIRHHARVNAVNHDGNTPLHQAARFTANFEVLRLLLENKAKPAIRNRSGMTPLHYLAIRNARGYSEFAFASGSARAANPQGPGEAADPALYGVFPMTMQASEEERVAAMKLLIDSGADPNIRNGNGDSVIDLERKFGKTPGFLRFLEARERKGVK